MEKICVIVDTSANIKNEEIPHVYTVPMIISTNDGVNIKTLHDQQDITPDEMLTRMIVGEVFKTASPIMGECMDLLDNLTKKYEHVIVIALPKTISGTYNQWVLLSHDYDNVKVYDFPIVGDGCKEIVKDVLKLGDVEQIDKYMQEAPKKNVIAIILNETKYLVRGGRLSALKGMVASLLKFKIVLYLNKDGVALYDKTFKPSSVISIVKKLFKETIGADVTNIDSSYIFSSGISSSAKLSNHAMIEELEKNFKIKANIKKLPCVIAAHVGPNYCALSVKIK